MVNALKLPTAETRSWFDANLQNPISGSYWSSTPGPSYYGEYLYFNSSSIWTNNQDRRNDGFSVRCFKN